MDTNIELLKLKYYLIPFTILLFSLLIFQSLYFFLCIFFILCIIYVIIFLKTKEISFLTILFFMWSLSLWSYVYFMQHTYDNISRYKKYFTKKEYKVIDKLVYFKKSCKMIQTMNTFESILIFSSYHSVLQKL